MGGNKIRSMNHLKLFEEFQDDPFYHLVNNLMNAEDEIANKAGELIHNDIRSKNADESIVLTASMMAALSLGKIAHVASNALDYAGTKVGVKEESIIMSVSKWLYKSGDNYTKGIYNLIMRISKKIPYLEKFLKGLTPLQKKEYVQAVFLSTFCILTAQMSDDIINNIVSGDDFLRVFAEINNVDFADDFANEMPKIMNATMATI